MHKNPLFVEELAPARFGARRSFAETASPSSAVRPPGDYFAESEDCFHLAFEGAGIGMALISIDGHWLHANRHLCDMLGYTEKELLAKTFQELTHPDDLLTSLDHARRVLLGKNQHCRLEKRYLHRDGHAVWTRRTLSLIRNPKGEIRYFFATIENMGERLRAEETLRRSEEHFHQLAACAPIGIFLLDPAGNVTYTNPKCREITGFTGDEWKDWLHPEDREKTLATWTQAVCEGAEYHGEMRFVQADGSILWIQADMVPLRDAHRKMTGYVGTCVDITELKQLQQQLVEQNAGLEEETARSREASRLKSEFLTHMSHELRTPLNGIIGFSELLQDQKAGPLTPQQAEFVTDVLHGARHLLRLINDLLDLAKIEAGKMELSPEPFLLRDAIARVSACLQPLLREKNIAYSSAVRLEDDRVQLDRQKFKQILYNLLSNAIKFTPSGGHISLDVGLGEREDEIKVTVRDTGIGIKPEDLGRLFIEFEQLDPASNRLHPGTGLGLALARKFTAMHGGAIRVESEIRRGTSFIVLFPREVRGGEKQ